MGVFSWLIMGLIVGILAKWIMPGKDPGGFMLTIVLGIAGAMVGGALASFIGLGDVTGFNLGSMAIATGGALLLLYLYRSLKK